MPIYHFPIWMLTCFGKVHEMYVGILAAVIIAIITMMTFFL